MDPKRWQTIENLCHLALEKETGQRGEFLREACAGDDSLREEVEALLDQLSKAESFIESPALDVAAKFLARSRESAVNSDLTGQSLSHYRVLDRIGSGGMGLVYRAHDEHLGRDVAIKVLPDVFATDPERLARLDREARLMATVSHPNVAAIHGVEVAEGKRFLVLELVEGRTLAQILEKGPLPARQALEICTQIAEGIEAAHNNGVIHRDLKPANVKVTSEGQVKVLDFGLAKPLAEKARRADAAQSPVITDSAVHPGLIIGTAAYMSPEQATGKPVDKRADIWAFGCILFECLTGKRAFQGETVSETLASILKEEPNWEQLPAATPFKVRDLLHRCLRKDPKKRMHDIADARIEIDEASSEQPVPRVASIRKPGRAWILGSLVGLAVGVAAAAIILGPLRKTPSLPVARTPLNIGPGLWLDGMRRTVDLERPCLTAMAVADDGRFMVYSAIPENPRLEAKPQIYLRRMDQMNATPIAGTEGGFSPFLSPDGRWVGFWDGRRLMKAPVNGGVPTTLCNAGMFFGADWEPGNRIILSKAGGLLRISGEGGKLEVLTEPEKAKEEFTHRLPHCLPDGKGVLFTIMAHVWDPKPRLALLDLKTRKWREVMDDAADGRYLRTGHLVFLRQGTLMAVAFDIDRLEVKGQPVPVVADVMQALNISDSDHNTAAGQYSVSDAGHLTYAPGGILPDAKDSLVRVDLKGEVQPVVEFKGPLALPRFSPDGRRIAYEMGALLWIYDISRGIRSPVTSERSRRYVWTPDGKGLVFEWFKSGPANIYRQPADGSSPMERLNASENWQIPGSFAPDGSILAFVEANPQTGYDILLLDMKSRRVTPFLNSKADEGYPEISPDGRWIAYASDETGRREVWLRPFPGSGGRWQISKEGGSEPVWAKDGKRLFYWQADQVWAVNIGTEGTFYVGKPRLLFEQGGFWHRGPIRDWDVLPDGKGFLMVKLGERKPQAVTEMILVQNWFEEVKRLVPAGK